MGDSDEDYNDSRRRDKFVRERNDYSSNRNNLSNSSNWQSNDNSWQQQDRSNNRNQVQRTDSFGRRERYSSPGYDMPSNKRSRPNSNNWNEDRSNYSQPNYDSYESYNVNQNQNDNTLTQPPMMSFKQFMRGLDDSIDHLEAAKKYNEYKFDFKRKQILEFFTAHKDEEWFRIKYHPTESVFRKKQLRGYVRYRAKVFFDLYKSELIDSTFIDIEKSDKITNVLDSAVIKLEGGTDYDLKCLDSKNNIADNTKDDQIDFINENNKNQEGGRNIIIVRPEGYIKESNENSMNENEDSEKNESESMDIKENKSNENSEILDTESKEDEKLESEESKNDLVEADMNENQTPKETDNSNEKTEDQQQNQDSEKAIDDTDAELNQDTGPRPLHKTSSIFLRYLPANITKVEIENMFKLYPQYLRVALADPAFDKRFQRRGWVTFNRNVDIRRIYLSLNNVRIRDCEVGAIINRDLSRRIRSVNGIASHRLNVLADLKHTSRIILNLDEEKKIWEAEEDEQGNVLEGLEEPITLFGYQTKNPILIDVENCFKETSNEESSVIDDTGEIKEDNDEEAKPLERDDNLIKVLDKLIFYLRIVHSLDYYNHIDYPNEDEMPNRIGIMHARGMAPTANITLKEVNDYIRQFESKIASYLERNVQLNEEELEKLGKKKIEDEIEKFISENTKEIKKELWFCPLSKKKFKGPNYVRKHIETKHADKLDEVKKDTEFFNSYLADSRRPQLPEHPFNRTGNKQQSNDNYSSNFNNSQSNYGNVHQRINFGGPNGGNNYNNGNRYNNYRNGSGNKFNNRKRIYRDLDAPVDDY